jgi:hypothetical protein
VNDWRTKGEWFKGAQIEALCTELPHSHRRPNKNQSADEKLEACPRKTSRGGEINVKDTIWGHSVEEFFGGSRLDCDPTRWTLILLPVRDAALLSVGDELKDDFLAPVQTGSAVLSGSRRQVQPMSAHDFVVAALTQ